MKNQYVTGPVRFVLILTMFFAGIFAESGYAAKTVCLIANHHTGQFDAYNLAGDGTMSFRARYSLQYQNSPSGLAIWEKRDENYFITQSYLFVSGEASELVELVNALSFVSEGFVSTEDYELAGLAVVHMVCLPALT